MESCSRVPPGFRFHPTDEELVDYYLRKKVGTPRMELDVIKDVDLYKIEPWDLQEICWRGGEQQSEWYFFSHKDKKYPTGTRTNRATASGFWKATGRDKAIYSKQDLIGMRKTLVFYKGRAPNGQKSDWIMHEYRLETEENGPPQEEGWVVCRVFKKKLTINNNVSSNINRRIMIMGDQESWFDDRTSFMQSEVNNGYFHLPLLESPRTLQASPSLSEDYNVNPYAMIIGTSHPSPLMQCSSSSSGPRDQGHNTNGLMNTSSTDQSMVDDHQMMDWRALDKFVASQLMSQEEEEEEDINKAETNNNSDSSHETFHHHHLILDKQDQMLPVNGSSSSCPFHLWK